MTIRKHTQRSRFAWLLALIAIVAYLLPWVNSAGAGLSLGAYDLAEWASLHPSVRYGSPALVTSLLLRLPLLLIALVLALNVSGRFRSWNWWITFAAILLIAVAALPPVEFFLYFRNDPNYQQQFVIALLTVIGGVLGLSHLLNRYTSLLLVVVAGVGIVVSVMGYLQAANLLQQFQLTTQPGVGFLLSVAVYVGVGGLAVRDIVKQKRGSSIYSPVE